MRKVLVFGTFDKIHKGHLFFLKKSKSYGDKLIVVLGRDKTILQIKGRLPENNEAERLKNLEKIGLIDEVHLGSLKDKYEVIEKIKPEVICIGYDQNSFTSNLSLELKKRSLKNVRIVKFRKGFHPKIYKSSKIK
jgi:FAD synthetase